MPEHDHATPTTIAECWRLYEETILAPQNVTEAERLLGRI